MSKTNSFNRIHFGWNIFFSIMLALVSTLILLPLILVVLISFSSAKSIALHGYSFFPSELSIEAYRSLASTGNQIKNSYYITIFNTVVGTIMSLAVSSMFAYVLAQKKFSARKSMTFFAFFTMLFSGGLVPTYILNVRYLHLNNTVWIFLLPTLVSAYHVIILRTFIQTTIPDSLIEAGFIDGAGHFTIFLKIVLPLFKAGLATIALFNVVARWNNWFTGMLYIDNPKLIPLQTLLQKIQKDIEFIKENAGKDGMPADLEQIKNMPTESSQMAITIISTIPILFAYPFFQKYFIKGLTIGGIKG